MTSSLTPPTAPAILNLFLKTSTASNLFTSSLVGPSLRTTCILAEGWCLTPNRPRPLMSSLLILDPFEVKASSVAANDRGLEGFGKV